MTLQSRPNKIIIATLGCAAICVVLLVSFLRVFFKDYELRQEIARTQVEVGTLQKRKIESLELLKRLQSDTYVEDRAREQLQATRPGEEVIVVPGLSVSSTAAATATPEPLSTETEELPNSLSWWYYFFHSSTEQSN